MEKVIKWNDKLLTWNNSYIRAEVIIPPAYPTSGLKGRWALTSNLTASVGGANFSRAYGSSDTFTDNALYFDQTKGYTCDSTTIAGITNGTGKYSISTWVKATSSSSAGQPIINIATSSATYISMGVTPTSLGAGVGWYGVRSASGTGDWPWWNKTIDNNWHHYVTTFESGKFYAYLDNVKLTQSANWGDGENTTRNVGSSQQYIYLGWGYDNGTTKFKGSLKYLYIYDHVLSSADRTTLYNSGTPL